MNIRQVIAACEARYLEEGGRASTWRKNYFKYLKHLPQDKTLSKRRLTALVKQWPPNTSSRQGVCVATKYVADCRKIDWSPGKLKGSYKPLPVDAQKIPEDSEIEHWYGQIKNPRWQWVYGAIATYGLRPHEAFRCDLEKFRQGDIKCHVSYNTKTGARRVWPIHPEWFETFALRDATLPNVNLNRENRCLGADAGSYFRKVVKLPFNLYGLRHAWARRAHLSNLNSKSASKMMGHTEKIHWRHYGGWFDDLILEKDYQDMLKNRVPRKPESL